MRDVIRFVMMGALAGCTGSTIDAGSSDGGPRGGDTGGAQGDGGPTVIASLIQVTPTTLATDGASVFWVSNVGAVGTQIWSVPVTGGPITSVATGPILSGFLAVDEVDLYYLGSPTEGEDAAFVGGGLYRAPKDGSGPPVLMSDPGAVPEAVTILGGNAYWSELLDDGNGMRDLLVVKTEPLQGGGVSVLASVEANLSTGADALGVTDTTGFVSSSPGSTQSFPLPSQVEGGVATDVPGTMGSCGTLLSDDDAVYCSTAIALFRVASDGTTTPLGAPLNGPFGFKAAFDDTDLYWVDGVTVGTIMRVRKTGGTPTIFARDTSPAGIAVDAHAVYFSDAAGNILRAPK